MRARVRAYNKPNERRSRARAPAHTHTHEHGRLNMNCAATERASVVAVGARYSLMCVRAVCVHKGVVII